MSDIDNLTEIIKRLSEKKVNDFNKTPFISTHSEITEKLHEINPELIFYDCYITLDFWGSVRHDLNENIRSTYLNLINNLNKKSDLDYIYLCCRYQNAENVGKFVQSLQLPALFRTLAIGCGMYKSDPEAINLIKQGNSADHYHQSPSIKDILSDYLSNNSNDEDESYFGNNFE